MISRTLSNKRFRWVLAACLGGAAVVAPLPPGNSLVRPARADQDDAVPLNVRVAIDRALAFLAKDQKTNGTFTQDPSEGTTAVPSLAILAFLARGHVPGQGPYGENLYRSIDYVIASQQEDGLISRQSQGNSVMYEHGISTVMLAEVYGMVDDARKAKIGKALAKSAKVILEAQRPGNKDKQMPNTGGWRYQVASPDADISVTGWQMMALRGAANCGAFIPPEQLTSAREYIRRSAVPGGGFAYTPGGGPNQARTGTGILMMELFKGLDTKLTPGEHPKEALAGGDWLLKNPPDNAGMEFYYYAIYYCSQALNQLGGNYWDTLYPKLRNTLLAQQDLKKESPTFGSFGNSNGGPAFRTAMACLALCVPYRYLPIYQADQ